MQIVLMMAAEYLSTVFQLLLIDMEKQNLNYVKSGGMAFWLLFPGRI